MQRVYTISSLMALSLLLTGCGGGSSSNKDSSPTPTPMSGVFRDAPVDNLRYVTPTFSGFTKNGGIFQYVKGEKVEFYIGNILIGSTTGKSLVTPIDIINGANDTTNIAVQNMLRILQSLDVDSNPSNGIVLFDKTKDFSYSGNIDLYSEAFVNSLITKINPNIKIVDSKSAIAHFNSQNGISTPNPTATPTTIPQPTAIVDPSPTPTLMQPPAPTIMPTLVTPTAVNTPIIVETPTTSPSATPTTAPSIKPTSTPTNSPSTGATAIVAFDSQKGEFKNYGNKDITINNLIVDFIGAYNLPIMTIDFKGTFDYVGKTVTLTTAGVTTVTATPEDLQQIYPMTVKANEAIPIKVYKYDIPVTGASGHVDYTYTFKTSEGDIIEKATLDF